MKYRHVPKGDLAMIKRRVQMLPKSRIAAYLAEALVKTMTGDEEEVPVTITVQVGKKSRTVVVNGVNCQTVLLPRTAQKLAFEAFGKFTGQRLAQLLGIGSDSVYNIRNSQRNLLPQHLERLRESIDIDPELLLLLEWLTNQPPRRRGPRN